MKETTAIGNSLNNNKKVLFVGESFILGFCRCNCGREIKIRSVRRGLLKRFVNLHNFRGKNNPSHVNPKTGNKSPSWNGGIRRGRDYLEIKRWDHHFCNSEGYVKLHRFVYEYFHKCCLMPWVHIHHINEVKTDNHKKNLLAVTPPEHTIIHNSIDMSNRYCLLCKSTTTYVKKNNGRPLWLSYQDGHICVKCYDKQRDWKKEKRLRRMRQNLK